MKDLPYRILLTDLDGTLLDSEHRVPPLTKKVLEQLTSQGVYFAMVSARMPEAIYPVVEAAGVPTCVISYSGALAEGPGGEILKSSELTLDSTRRVLAEIEKRWPKAVCNYYAGHTWYVEQPEAPLVRLETEVTGAVPVKEDFSKLLEQGVRPHKLLCMAEEGMCGEMERKLGEAFPELNVIRSCGFLLEIMDASVSKASGVRSLLDALGLAQRDAVAFGDSYNDIPMLREAGLGVAMENAPEEVKRAAGAVTLSNDREGIYEFLKNCGMV